MLKMELQGRKKRGRTQKVHGCSGEGRAKIVAVIEERRKLEIG